MSPVNPDTPEPLKGYLEDMERIVQSTKTSLAFAAPELQDTHWALMQNQLAEVIQSAVLH
jgi:hypothetical protein